MVEPINMQIIVTNIDEVAKARNIQEHNLTGQQINAQRDAAKEIERQTNTIVETKNIDKKGIENEKDAEKNQYKGVLLRKKKEKTKKEEEKHEKTKEPNKGGLLDVEA